MSVFTFAFELSFAGRIAQSVAVEQVGGFAPVFGSRLSASYRFLA